MPSERVSVSRHYRLLQVDGLNVDHYQGRWQLGYYYCGYQNDPWRSQRRRALEDSGGAYIPIRMPCRLDGMAEIRTDWSSCRGSERLADAGGYSL